MKKIFALLCLMIIASGAFALDKAIGVGGLFGYSFNGGDVDSGVSPYIRGTWDMSRMSYGACGFFGISQFVEFNVGYLYKSINNISMIALNTGEKVTLSGNETGINDTGALQLGVYFKYPFYISDIFIFFPTVGSDVEITISSNRSWWNDLWLRGGIGLDIFFTEKLFLRVHGIYGAAIPFGGNVPMFKSNFGHGLLVKAGFGFML